MEQTILYSNKKLGKARRYNVRWVMDFPDKWFPCDKVPKELKDMYETENENRKERRKTWNFSSDKASEVKIFDVLQNEVYERLLAFFMQTISSLTFDYNLF